MLSNLRIENVAVIEKATISFENGLNILTGETGAGKSIVIDSINAVLGERTSKELVRDGASAAKVTAFFDFISPSAADALSELDIEPEEDGSLLISRTIAADGRSSCKVNGQSVTVSMLRRIGTELISICGQHDSQKLLQKECHLKYIDTLAGLEKENAEYDEIYREVCRLKNEISALRKNDGDKLQRLEFLKYQIDELENADITVGEWDSLNTEKKKEANKEKITEALYAAHGIICGDEDTQGLADSLYMLSSFLAQLSDYHAELGEYVQSVDNLRYELEDCQSELSRQISTLDETETDINAIEERLDILYRMSRKYGGTEQEMLDHLEKIKAEYESITTSDEKAAELEQRLKTLSETLMKKAAALSGKRQKFAAAFEEEIMQELSYLDMPHAVFKVDFKTTEPKESGIDDVEFLISANIGQQPKPLAKIASGGELSRVMLAIRSVISQSESVETLIFDEIDTGVSGRAAHKIGYKLKQAAVGKQVICVTHLAQIAAGADNHLLIEKYTEGGKTYTLVTGLDGNDRIREIARIIGGDVVTDTTMQSAKELIDFADTP